jgi:thiol-disulfide isomerase/thioredoxin
MIKTILTVMLLGIGCAANAGHIDLQPPQEPPTIDIYDLDNKRFDLKKLEGNVVVLHFWATWCATCSESMEQLNRLQKLVKKDPIIIVPISEDFKGQEVIEQYYKDHNLENLVAFVDRSNAMFRAFKITNLPATFVLNPSGQVVAEVRSKTNWLDAGVVDSLKKCVAIKAVDNPDYVELLSAHQIQPQMSKPVITQPELKIPRGGESYAIPEQQKEIK